MNQEDCALQEAQKIYTDVSNWLVFCELKHAGMFAAYVALFIAVLQLNIKILVWARVFVLVSLAACLACNIISFVPFLNHRNWIRKKAWQKINPHLKENRVLYLSIFQKSHKIINGQVNDVRSNYKNYFQSSFSSIQLNPDSLLDNYLDQIVEVSSVAAIKYYLFGVACKMSILVGLSYIALIIFIA